MTTLAKHLQIKGEIAIIPTDTVYGVVARASDQLAVARLYELKHREAKPGTLVAANVGQLVDMGIEREYLAAVEKYWPGAVSVIIPCNRSLAYLHQGINSLAIRIPDDVWLHDLLEQTGPLLTSSANQPGLLMKRRLILIIRLIGMKTVAQSIANPPLLSGSSITRLRLYAMALLSLINNTLT
jgi:L-threonylcarbamoyladenylate synthase